MFRTDFTYALECRDHRVEQYRKELAKAASKAN